MNYDDTQRKVYRKLHDPVLKSICAQVRRQVKDQVLWPVDGQIWDQVCDHLHDQVVE